MALEEKYSKTFQSECDSLSQAILGSLQKLSKNPKDPKEICNLIQSADTVMGNARFLQNKKLEQNATSIIKSFRGVSDVRKKIEEFGIAVEQFGSLVGSKGACPKGYVLVNGKCVSDNASYIKNHTKQRSYKDGTCLQ
ncbi:MAG: hypothetical protein ACW9W4_08560 [Candidatus Nitrosopumilus sp. bin_7KS]